ncbi:docking protein 1b [Polyodon spathula]|uniref:docking protein 1b n=1 Tax=Polyodon spathula TaxID=7913 RepID=UPI001B7E102E|nr:docking protein 1b [Polyodon spathula]
MDKAAKEGQLYVQHQKFGKKWKKNWFVLYPASQNGIARLEYFDCSNPSEKLSTKKLDKKIIRLAECISILPAITETCPKENMAAFCVETNEKIHVFATEKQAMTEWVEKLCEIAFQGNIGDLKRSSGSDSSSPSNNKSEMEMAENLIYYSRDEVSEFWVSMQKTEASERCGLQGSYCLKAGKESLLLKEPKTKQTLFAWPYKLLRRYGRDKVMFSFEAGRRCDSGPGNFTFETKQGNEIFQIVEAAIKEQKAQAEENRQSCPSLDSDSPDSQQIRNAIAESMGRGGGGGTAWAPQIMEPESDTPAGSKSGSADGIFTKRDGRQAEDKLLKARSLPDPPGLSSKSPSTPPRSPLPRLPKSSSLLEDQAGLYSEPMDAVRPPKPFMESLYSDPMDSIKPPAPAPRQRHTTDEPSKPYPLYSDINDQVTYNLAQKTPGFMFEGGRNGGANPEEHIYDEPEGRARQPSPADSSVYDEARLGANAWRKQGLDDQTGHEIPYNPSTDDYCVPPYVNQQQPRPKGPKPLPAPKPQIGRKEPPPLPLGKANFNNSNSKDIYSTVMKSNNLSLYLRSRGREDLVEAGVPRSPESVYEDLGSL